MDGAPVKGESIPIRVFLAGYDLTPTMRDINKKFSVKYYLNLVLVDEEERRYFKQQVCWYQYNIKMSDAGNGTANSFYFRHLHRPDFDWGSTYLGSVALT